MPGRTFELKMISGGSKSNWLSFFRHGRLFTANDRNVDDEAFYTALETLSGLRQDGKLIGLVSHVSVFNERIATRIRVVLQTGGGVLSAGRGCGKFEKAGKNESCCICSLQGVNAATT